MELSFFQPKIKLKFRWHHNISFINSFVTTNCLVQSLILSLCEIIHCSCGNLADSTFPMRKLKSHSISRSNHKWKNKETKKCSSMWGWWYYSWLLQVHLVYLYLLLSPKPHKEWNENLTRMHRLSSLLQVKLFFFCFDPSFQFTHPISMCTFAFFSGTTLDKYFLASKLLLCFKQMWTNGWERKPDNMSINHDLLHFLNTDK